MNAATFCSAQSPENSLSAFASTISPFEASIRYVMYMVRRYAAAV